MVEALFLILEKLRNGVWVPKDLSGLTFGNNGFHLDFGNASALGADVSGNSNSFGTLVNIAAPTASARLSYAWVF